MRWRNNKLAKYILCEKVINCKGEKKNEGERWRVSRVKG